MNSFNRNSKNRMKHRSPANRPAKSLGCAAVLLAFELLFNDFDVCSMN